MRLRVRPCADLWGLHVRPTLKVHNVATRSAPPVDPVHPGVV